MRQNILDLPKSVQHRIKALKNQTRRKSVIIFKVTDKFVETPEARKRFESYVRNSSKSEMRAAKTSFTYL